MVEIRQRRYTGLGYCRYLFFIAGGVGKDPTGVALLHQHTCFSEHGTAPRWKLRLWRHLRLEMRGTHGIAFLLFCLIYISRHRHAGRHDKVASGTPSSSSKRPISCTL